MRAMDPKITSRLDHQLRGELNAINKRFGCGDTTVVQELLAAWVKHVKNEGKVEFPVKVSADVEGQRALLAAEDPGTYGKKQR